MGLEQFESFAVFQWSWNQSKIGVSIATRCHNYRKRSLTELKGKRFLGGPPDELGFMSVQPARKHAKVHEKIIENHLSGRTNTNTITPSSWQRFGFSELGTQEIVDILSIKPRLWLKIFERFLQAAIFGCTQQLCCKLLACRGGASLWSFPFFLTMQDCSCLLAPLPL